MAPKSPEGNLTKASLKLMNLLPAHPAFP
jgi:hypothetical protein